MQPAYTLRAMSDILVANMFTRLPAICSCQDMTSTEARPSFKQAVEWELCPSLSDRVASLQQRAPLCENMISTVMLSGPKRGATLLGLVPACLLPPQKSTLPRKSLVPDAIP